MRPISVMVVDDSVVVRRLVTDVLSADPDITVVGTAPNGRIAIAKMPQLNPDVISLDVEMPVMDGLETLRELRTTYPDVPVIMFSTLTERGATATLEALELGAQDYVTKPANVGSVQASMASVREQLVPKIKALHRSRPGSRAAALGLPHQARDTAAGPGQAAAAPVLRTAVPREPVGVVVLGVSTGGPDALATVLPALPATLAVPVVVVQHMPPTFTRLLAQRLDGRSALEVREAQDGDEVRAGRVLLAPGDFHLRVHRSGTSVVARLDQGTPENFCRPSVDVLFRSAAQLYGGGCLAVVLTGMGSDGARGAGDVVAAGGQVLAQDQATSVVWGMPGAVAQAGLATRLLPLPEVAGAIRRLVERSPHLAAGAR
ncbi:MAG TPA: chemotaxis response regulator protein-glutamate methylesterase [Actinomycetales bacterium]|nr:chemotaxis response regulator protein-glutamate methylesterase [Actinomycetales bacterium]